MTTMEIIRLDEENILDYMVDTLTDLQVDECIIDRARYHHNARYSAGISIVKNGILSINELNRLRIRKDTTETIQMLGDINSHINGNDGISLSVVGLTDLYRDEDEYDPFSTNQLDILISSKIKAARNSIHYGNEFIAMQRINPEDIKAIDIRLLKYIRSVIKSRKEHPERINRAVIKYNNVIGLARCLERNKMMIPIREMSSEENISLDTSKLAKIPVLQLKTSSKNTNYLN